MATKKSALPKERQHFSLLTLSNPNYFGNLAGSPYKSGVATPLIGQTAYEQLRCVGLNPQFDYVEAVVDIKQDTGYSGGICTSGSYEYVRFYADYTNTGVWTDLGMASVRVRDIPGDKPLSYTLRVPMIDPPRKFCFTANIVKVRAILSWTTPPPPATPNYPPVWGHSIDVNVQIRPRYRLFWAEILTELQPAILQKISPDISSFLSAVDTDSELQIKPKKLDLAEKQRLYAEAKIPTHRFAFAEVKSAAAKPLLLSTQAVAAKLPASAIEDLIKAIQTPTHNPTEYEEVTCAGYRPEEDSVGAVVTVKKPNGYSGSLCTTGSPEYVAFWADAGGWQFLGMTAVQVHDLNTVPAGGVQYAVNLPVDTTVWRQLCTSGAKVVKLRAVLSWSTPPSSTDPDDTPYWGNRFDTLIQLRPGDPTAVGIPQLLNISGYSVSSDPITNEIDPTTGLTVAGDAPFGGILAIRGVLPGHKTYDRYYRIDVKRASAPDTSYGSLMNPVTLRIFEENGSSVVDCSPALGFQVECFPVITPVDLGDGLGAVWYKYQNYESGGIRRHVEDQTLGYWHTTPGDEGLWNIRVTFRDGLVETTPSAVTVFLDNTPPSINASWSAAVEATCNKTGTGVTVVGSYTVNDVAGTPAGAQHLSSLSIQVIPALPGAVVGFGPTPSASSVVSRSYPTLPGTGETGAFSMKSTTACGYALRFVANDRTVVGYFSGPNFNTTNFYAEDDLGICVD